MPKKTFSSGLVAEVQRRVAAGQSSRQVARALEVPRSTISAILRDRPPPMLAAAVRASVLVHPRASRVLLHPWLREPQPLPPDFNAHRVVRTLYNAAFSADPVRASELDVLIVAFDLPVQRVRAYLNAMSAERLRARFDLVADDYADDGETTGRPTMPVPLWSAALGRLRDAFERQELQMAGVRDRLLAALPTAVDPDAV